MTQKTRLTQFILAAVVMSCVNGSVLAAWGSERPPAGQMCPVGSFVIGFDAKKNIICSATCGNDVLNPGESCDDGNTEDDDSCPATCQSEVIEPKIVDGKVTVQAPPTVKSLPQTATNPIISDVTPSKLMFGTRELALTISGTGFHTDTVIKFAGVTYSPSVNQTGTRLEVTIPTRSLSIGPYAITVSNGPGMDTMLKRALEIY
jgi:cysteine-rich repeat protein